jgi:hypothetical protein
MPANHDTAASRVVEQAFVPAFQPSKAPASAAEVNASWVSFRRYSYLRSSAQICGNGLCFSPRLAPMGVPFTP